MVIDTVAGDTSVTVVAGPSFPVGDIYSSVFFSRIDTCLALDTVPFVPCLFDLALKKEFVSSTGGLSTNYGDTLCLNVVVFNQQQQTVTNIKVNDYLPSGYNLLSGLTPEWADFGNRLVATIPGPLAFGESDTIPLKLEIIPSNEPGAYLNIAEIASFDDINGVDQSDNDVDSTPDDDPTNDAGGSVGTASDDVVDGDGTGMPGDPDPLTDEDDADPYITNIFDLALTKVVVTPPPYDIGQSVTFAITVFNQGSVTAQNVKISDYIPLGFMFDPINEPNWMLMGSTAMDTINGPIVPGGSAMTTIDLIVQQAAVDEYVNYAEISYAEDNLGNNTGNGSLVDIDSTPDEIADNDAGGNPDTESDDSVDGDGSGMYLDTDPLTDEDDMDPAGIELPFFSLGNIVWFDPDNDGILDPNEAGIDNVNVSLYLDANMDGIPDGPAIDMQTTTGGGYYLFDLLLPGTYLVGIDNSSFDAGQPLENYGSSTGQEDANADIDSTDNGADLIDPTYGILSTPVELSLFMEPNSTLR